MSFPRAKLKRFNENAVPTPSPAQYNVELKEKPKLAIIPQCERFAELCRSPTSSESGYSVKSSPCFKAPSLIGKKKPCAATKLKLSYQELLNQKIVECSNKDIFIKELTEQLEEIKEKLFAIDKEKDHLENEKQKFVAEIETLNKKHDDIIADLNKTYNKELEDNQTKIKELNEEIESIKKWKADLELQLSELRDSQAKTIKKYNEEIDLLKLTIEDNKIKITNLNKKNSDLEQRHSDEIETLKKEHRKELQEIEFEMLRCVSESQKILEDEKRNNTLKLQEIQSSFRDEIINLKQQYERQKEICLSEKDSHIQNLERKFSELKIMSEVQIKEKNDELEQYWKNKLESKEKESNAILKECQSISEYNIIQCELEKSELQKKINSKEQKYKDIEKKYDTIYYNYKQLQSSYSNIQNKLYRMIKELRDKEINKQHISHLLNEKSKYELTIDKLQNTIEVLKKRLLDSDLDVENLKSAINSHETKLLEYKNNVDDLNKELETLKSRNQRLENENKIIVEKTKAEISDVKTELFKSIDGFKETAESKIDFYKTRLEQKSKDYQTILNQLHDQKKLTDKASELISQTAMELDDLDNQNVKYRQQINDLQNENKKLNEENQELLEENYCCKEINSKLKIQILQAQEKSVINSKESNDRIAELEDKVLAVTEEKKVIDEKHLDLEKELEKLRIKNEQLEEINKKQAKKIEDQQNLIQPFKEQLEAYELEMNSLQTAKNYMENEAKDLGLKYAQILGHQNQKQKIKYMVNLKLKVDELTKAKLDLEAKIKVQDKKLEKMKKENADIKKTLRKPLLLENKENSSPNKSFNLKCESPLPLKEIN